MRGGSKKVVHAHEQRGVWVLDRTYSELTQWYRSGELDLCICDLGSSKAQLHLVSTAQCKFRDTFVFSAVLPDTIGASLCTLIVYADNTVAWEVEDNSGGQTLAGQLPIRVESGYVSNNGTNLTVTGQNAWAEGRGTVASGNDSHAEGYYTKASGLDSHAEGFDNTASGVYSHAEGTDNTASGAASHAEGSISTASGDYSHAEGGSKASGAHAHSEGDRTEASGSCSHAEGNYGKAIGDNSHAEGYATKASGNHSHAEGYATKAEQRYAHSEGAGTTASGDCAHAEGRDTAASAHYSHAEGETSTASGTASHAEGGCLRDGGGNISNAAPIASGARSHAEGCATVASGANSHAQGFGTRATGDNSAAIGKYNDDGTALLAVGNGTADNARSDCFKVDSNGDTWVKISGALTKITSENLRFVIDDAYDWIDITNEWSFVNGFRLYYNGSSPGEGNAMTILYSPTLSRVRFTGSMRINNPSYWYDSAWHEFLQYTGNRFYTSHNTPDLSLAPKVYPAPIGGLSFVPATDSVGTTISVLCKLGYIGSPSTPLANCALAMQMFLPQSSTIYGAIMQGLQLSVTPIS